MKRPLILLSLFVSALLVLGVLMLYSSTHTEAAMPRFRSHLNWLGLGLILAPLLAWFDYNQLQRRPALYALGGLCLVLLIAVFIPGLGVQTNGANRWIRGLGQPSEFAKPVVIVLLAAWCARLSHDEMRDLKKGFLLPSLLGGGPAFLIFAEPDWGTAVLLGILTLAMLTLAGARWSHSAGAVACASVSLAIMVAHNPIRLKRVLVFLDPEAHVRGSGWQVTQSLIAIGSGGWRGRFMDGSPHKYGFVPEQQTDFVFARIGEETGLWGASLVVMLFLGILVCGLLIVKHAPNRFGQLVAGGCTMAVTLQALINIAVATSMVPNKGLPLPFVSYGGSNMLAMSICVGLLGSVACRSHDEACSLSRDTVSQSACSKTRESITPRF